MHTIENSRNTLTELLQRVQDQAHRAQDYVSDTRNLQFKTEGGASSIILERSGGEPTTELLVNDVAFDQVAARSQLPVQVARRFRDDYPDVLDHAVRRIWDQEPENRMVRSFLDTDETHGMARAFVSDKFKTFDNHHLLSAALPQLIDSPAQWQVVTGDITDKRLYLQLKSEAIQGQPAVGDLMAHGLRITNSEVGHGSIGVVQLAWTLICLNGMQTSNAFRKAHLGAAHQTDSDFASILEADTIEASNEALKLQLRDVIASFASEDAFRAVLEQFRQAHGRVVAVSPQIAVDRLGGVLKLTKPEVSNVLDGLMATIQQPGYAGRPISQATLVNAVTQVQHKAAIDDAGDWQRRGAKVLEFSDGEWEAVAA